MVKFLKNSVQPLDSSKVSSIQGNYSLRVVQQPVKARVAGRKQTRNSSRRLVDPQPVVEIRLNENEFIDNNVIDHSLSMFFIRASIECLGSNDKESFFQKQRKSRFFEKTENDEEVLRGTTAVSAQFYRGSPYTACAVFDNLSVRYKGSYRLKFDLFEVQSFSKTGSLSPNIVHRNKATSYSSVFTVYTDAAFDGLEASPELNNELKKAGCKIRARKQRNITGSHSNMVDLDGFRVDKKFTYNNGRMNYSLTGTNHFGLDENVFNRPGTSLDLQMLQNFQSAQAAATAAAVNIANRNDNAYSPAPIGNLHTGFNQIKRPQTALPQIITTGEHFNTPYNDMLRSGLASSSDYNTSSPLAQPKPRRNFNIQSAEPSFNVYSEMFSTINTNDSTNSVDASPSIKSEEFASPAGFPGINQATPSATATPVAMSNNHHQQLFSAYTIDNQHMMSMMMNNNNNAMSADGNTPINNLLLQQTMGMNINMEDTMNSIGGNGDVPRSTIPLEQIPIFWNDGDNVPTNTQDGQLEISQAPDSANGSDSIDDLTDHQQQQLKSFQAQIEQQHQNQQQLNDGTLLVDNIGASLADNQLDLGTELLNFNEIYQQSDLLLRQNFQI